ncbi:MAG: hypothetical protein U0T32_02370 [Chitinophagales bacterium]|jgi:gamma-glutamylcyclotransferase (GGCT)/AIG2-like uncharacterized protein YtfP
MKFNKKGFPKDLITIIDANQDHRITSRAIEEWINAHPTKDVNVYLCWAHFEWLCPLYTELDEDYIADGASTLKILDLALSIDPENAEALKNKVAVEKRMKKAQKSIDALFKYDKMDIYKLDIGFVAELAYQHTLRAHNGDKISAGKAYKIYERLYKEKPDVFTHSENSNVIFTGNNLLYLTHMACAKYLESGYEAAEVMIHQVLNWKVAADKKAHSHFITEVYWIELLHLAEQDNFMAFQQLFQEWTGMETYTGQVPSCTYTYLVNPVTDWLLKQFAKQELKYILEHNYGGISSTVLTAKDKQLMNAIEQLLTNN